MKAAMLAMFNVAQVHTEMRTWGRGFYQQGQQIITAQSVPVTVGSAKRFIRKSVYDAVATTAIISLGDFMQLPRRGKLTPQQTMQYIDAIQKTIHWTWRTLVDGTPDFDESDVDDPDDTTWRVLDLSAIVGAKAMLVTIHMDGVDNLTGSELDIRNGSSTTTLHRGVYTSIANQPAHGDVEVQTDSSGHIEFHCDPKPTDWTSIDIYVVRYKPA